MSGLHQNTKKMLTGGALVLSVTASLYAQQKPFMEAGTAQPPALPVMPKAAPPVSPAAGAPGTNAVVAPGPGTNAVVAAPLPSNPVDNFFNTQIPGALAKGKFNLNVRARYEGVDQDGVTTITKHSYAPTIRTRFGYTSASLYGFQGMLEGVNVSVLGPEHDYNAAGANGQGNRPIVADPPLTRFDQAWVGYSYSNWISAKAGEQRLVLDNHRFIGDVGWRQNMQTYEAVSVGSEPVAGLNLYYGFLWDVHRVFGNVTGLPAANTDFTSRSHLINVSYSGWKYGRFVAYTYLLDLHNGGGDANSCATYGGYFAGAFPVSGWAAIDYRAEYAWQSDYANSPLRYSADYYNLELGATIKPFAVGAGYENLGSGANTGAGGGRASFRTPLATLHAFNGWADVFLTTPANGLRDFYAYAQATLPGQVPLRFVYHKYDAASIGGDYGDEFDAVASKKFGKNWTALVKYAYYQGKDAPAPSLAVPNVDVQKIWAQLEFNF